MLLQLNMNNYTLTALEEKNKKSVATKKSQLHSSISNRHP